MEKLFDYFMSEPLQFWLEVTRRIQIIRIILFG